MAARHRFIPTQRPVARQTASRTLVRAGAAWTIVLAVVFLMARPFFRSADAADIPARFTAYRGQFHLLKDMLFTETTITSIGLDNVREYWLFDGRWSSPRRPADFLSRSEMLAAVDLSPERYDAYLDILKSIGAHRVVRTGEGNGRRITVNLFPPARGEAARLVYDPSRAPSSNGTALGDGWFLEIDAA